MTITQECLKEKLLYNRETGDFIWRSPPIRRASSKGKKAGGLTDKGYWRISLDNKRYRAHRLAWLYEYGEFPLNQIDHINGIRTDNRIANLRLANNAENSANSKKYSTNKSGYKGVSWSKSKKKWMARLTVNYKGKFLGYYKCPKEAHLAYCREATAIYGEFARTA